ncbi:MAG: hypothetical protein K1X67_15795 [Fimbriimonadaceae bacterium]|nr:hypothetical protein [Fimbriimonadaceae bacterium]
MRKRTSFTFWAGVIAMVAGGVLLVGCGKADEAKTGADPKNMSAKSPTDPMAKTTPGKLEVPPVEKHKSEAPPSPDMKGEWVLEPSERQRVINAQLVARGKKAQETSLKIEGGKFELKTSVDPVETVITGDAKQEGTKIILTATAAESTMEGKKIKSRIPEPQTFTLQPDQLTIKDSGGLVYVRK